MWWGLRCYPAVRSAYVLIYYALAGVAVVSAVRANSVLMRAAPMLVRVESLRPHNDNL